MTNNPIDRVSRLKALSDKCFELHKLGQSAYTTKLEIQKLHLDGHKDLPFEVYVEISVAPDCCTECLEYKKLHLSLEEAYKQMPLPHKECKDKRGCRCRYLLIPKRDDSGGIIKKIRPCRY